ncbi:hypothetical protein Taro_025808 [Colocasia esculenta]|uniref:CCHC-type domain-containing protein n=1 Tax=Colocasia esculenta TaxID=4460 RepID=A0A843VPD8_COLES|nr:hypothetical protein [Colocasia esculenta]
MLSRRLQRILAKKKKFQSGRRYFKKNKDFKKPEVKDSKKGEPICYECKKLGHIKAECPKHKKSEYRKKESSRKPRRFKKKAMAVAWDNSSDSNSESSSSSEEEEEANLAFMDNTEEKAIPYRLRHRLPEISSFHLFPARNFLRGSTPFFISIIQKLFPSKTMASSGVFSSVGGYGAAFLTTEQQERYASVKTKLCGHKAVDVADLQKSGMGSIIVAMNRLKWTKIATLSEVSYPNLVKAFYVCLKTEEDGTLTSMVKGTQIKVTRDLLASLFGVTSSGHSGVHTVDIQVKGLGIVGPEYRLKDGKLDINQLNAFNRLLHFIVCQIVVPRSATFSTCTKADSDLMFWAIQNQEINTAEIMIERMKFASAQVWDTKSKLNVSLPYAHLITKIFQHYDISVVGDVSEKMGQAIRSKNLRKSEAVASGHIDEIVMEDAPSQGEQVVAHENSVIEDAPIEGEQHVDEQAAIQGKQNDNAPIDDHFREGIVERPSGPIIVEQQQEEERPSGTLSEDPAGPPGPIPVENELIEEMVDTEKSGPAGPAEDALPLVESMAAREEDQAVAPEPSVLPTLPTPAPPSPPTSSTAPPAPLTFKRPRSRTISSPTPFSSQTPSSPTSSTIIPPPLSVEGAQLAHTEIQDIKDEFEVAILRSVLAVGTHSHKTGSSSPIPKKRRLTSTHPVSSEPCYPPLWFSLSITNKQQSIYEEYLQKKEIKFIRHYKMYYDYCYLNSIPEVQLGQFREAIRVLSSRVAHTEPLRVDFGTLARSNQPLLTPGDFLDANSLHLVWDSFMKWEEWYRVFLELKKELRQHQVFYPFKITQFLQFASFGCFTSYKVALRNDKYWDSYRIRGSFTSRGWLPPWDPPIALSLEHFKPILKSRNAKRYLMKSI